MTDFYGFIGGTTPIQDEQINLRTQTYNFPVPTTNFPVETDTYFKLLNFDEKREVLHYHQYITHKFMMDHKQRGLLIFHSMGFGKTLLAASITEAFRKLDPTRKPIILLPKSLHNNFVETVKTYMFSEPGQLNNDAQDEYVTNTIDEHYSFISLNSSNMFRQIGQIDKTAEEIEFEKSLDLFTQELDDHGSNNLENSILVIDEYQNLSNAITNGSKNALKLYNKIMNTNNIRLIFLTGTPLINHPFEIVCTVNMLKGKVDNELIFPENIRDFMSFFIDRKENKIKNKGKFQNRITGVISYYGDMYFQGNKPDFPEEYPIKIEEIPMSKEQFTKYLAMREIEKKEESRKFKMSSGEDAQFSEKGSASSSYRIRSRQVSNFLIPDQALTHRGSKSALKDISKIPSNVYKQLDIYSPKFQKILENIQKHDGQLSLVFSQFTSAEGLTIFSKILEANGYVPWDNTLSKNDVEIEGGKIQPLKKTFALYHGDIPPSIRNEIVNTFNSKSNMHGEKISVLLISHQTGGLGLDLHGVRSIHIMEPYWNWALISQIIKRGVRYKSHDGYPKSEQNVQPYLYISTFPETYVIKETADEDSMYTTDMHLYRGAIAGRTLIDSFLLAMIEASIDCSTHHKNLSPELKKYINCHMCLPTDERLYEPNFYKDMKDDDKCTTYSEKKINVKELIYESEEGESKKFYYDDTDKSNPKIFEYNSSIDGYMLLQPSHPYYADLIRKILGI